MPDLTHVTPITLTEVKALEHRIREALAPFAEAMRRMARWLGTVAGGLRDAANTPENVAGLEGRYFVRAGLAHFDPDADPGLVLAILRGEAEDTYWLTPANRRVVACAAMLGAARRGVAERPRYSHHRWGQDAAQLVLR